METRAPDATPPSEVSVEDMKRYRKAWMLEGRYRPLSDRTVEKHESVTDEFFWWLDREGIQTVGTPEIRSFLLYVHSGHHQPKGRWDNPGSPANREPVKPATMQYYFGVLQTFSRWMYKQGYVGVDLMEGLDRPIVREDQIQPFTEEQVHALLRACKKTDFIHRNEAIVWFLLDTGIRASELCALRMRDLDILGHHATVHGKGGKSRVVYFSPVTARALNAYLRKRPDLRPDEFVFAGKRDPGLSRNALLQLIRRLGTTAGLDAVRCSPHTFRHTFAIWFLRRGGSSFTLQHLLGHTDLKMTRRYVAIAETDAEEQHHAFSPAEYLQRHRSAGKGKP